jgi:hypothetical protein
VQEGSTRACSPPEHVGRNSNTLHGRSKPDDAPQDHHHYY